MSAKVSVLMPVFNGERFISSAIESILGQTYQDFELIILSDGSTDRSVEIAKSYKDNRIQILKFGVNRGLAVIRNTAIQEAGGDYIAWLDCDDFSDERRLQEQIGVMEKDENIGLCGTWVKVIGGQEIWRYPIEYGCLRSRMLFDDPLATSSVMIRASVLKDETLRFDSVYPPIEDYELWERVSRATKTINIPKILTHYRVYPEQITARHNKDKQKELVWKVQNRQLEKLGIYATSEEKQLHLKIGVEWGCIPKEQFLYRAESWLVKLVIANNEKEVFPIYEFQHVVSDRWGHICNNAVGLGINVWNIYRQSSVSKYRQNKLQRSMGLLLRSLHLRK